ncbi:adenylate isopentenyltransferase 3, chloroplastic [Beta vulgaris subsp. vulgaris]|uniref:adenylate isopentenyltransferase 3, chloroplastic n=1 Tax=Beta vulgaris subsp. vulgaris TaxID=3555 RepID=UPI0020368A47|nr:adenylate isopentenyltransferase 3, chloroplastic [Beta vulgaris subsp. vulgaris]
MSSLPMQMWKQAQPLLKIPTSLLKKEVLNPWKQQRDKVVFIMGATGTGKSRLSIDLATSFPAEIINSDKIQVYKGLDIVTNKITRQEQCGVPHHLLDIVNPNVDYKSKDFCLMATHAVESILQQDKLPIIVGGSNSYIESLVSDPKYGFKFNYDCCFLWVDVSVSVLHKSVSNRVDKMVQSGLVDEVRGIFDPYNSDYTRGIRQAIGVPEFDTFFRTEHHLDESDRDKQLQGAISEIKENTCKLVNKQLKKIHILKHLKAWELYRLDATEVFNNGNEDVANDAWHKMVTQPSLEIVTQFLSNTRNLDPNFSARRVLRNMIEQNHPLIATA